MTLIKKSIKDKTAREIIDEAYQGVKYNLDRGEAADDYEGESKEEIQEFLYRGFTVRAAKIAGVMWKSTALENTGKIVYPGKTQVLFESPLMEQRTAIQFVQSLIDNYVSVKRGYN